MSNPNDPFEQFMGEWERAAAPFKLVLRLLRTSPPKQSTPKPIESESEKERSPLMKVLGWEGLSFVFFVGLALAFLNLPNQMDLARWFFVFSGIALAVKAVNSVESQGWTSKVIVVIGFSICIALLINIVLDWTLKLEIAEIAKDALNKCCFLLSALSLRKSCCEPKVGH